MQIRITNEAHNALRRFAINFKETGIRQPNGDWLIAIDDETCGALEARMFAGETYSDCILRLISGLAS